MVKERLHYVDVTKGLLILMVVYGHIYGQAIGVKNVAVDYIHQSCNLFVSFYMPCFFVITGFCSNFNRPFHNLLISSFKTIVLPGITLSTLIMMAQRNLTFNAFTGLGKDILFFGGRYWFLSALFVAKMLYWMCIRYHQNMRYVLCVLSFSIGYVLSIYYHGREYWWFVHALLLMPFLEIGYVMKSFKIPSIRVLSVVFGILLVLTIVFSHFGLLRIDYYYHVPGITQKLLNNNFTMLVPLVLLSVVGSLWLIGVSKVINSNKALEYLGRNSLIIYCIHGAILSKSISLIIFGKNLSIIGFSIRMIIVYLLTICASCLIAYILNQKYLKTIIGKF